jgi:hypothetical protein
LAQSLVNGVRQSFSQLRSARSSKITPKLVLADLATVSPTNADTGVGLPQLGARRRLVTARVIDDLEDPDQGEGLHEATVVTVFNGTLQTLANRKRFGRLVENSAKNRSASALML